MTKLSARFRYTFASASLKSKNQILEEIANLKNKASSNYAKVN